MIGSKMKLLCMMLCFAEFILGAAKPGELPANFNPDLYTIRKAVECSPRNGLPNFFKKLEAGEPVVISYFGGSITFQSGYRVQLTQHLKKLSPTGNVIGLNASIGGTTSELGSLRCRYDVLQKKPDLVLVEFAVNDSFSSSTRTIRRGMEGIVRQIRRSLPETDILFVYTVDNATMKDLVKNNFSKPVCIMEEIADYYGIPSIHMALQAARLLKAGKLVMNAKQQGVTRLSGKELNLDSDVVVDKEGRIPFAPDGCHPYGNTGHVLYTDAIRRSLPAIREAGLGRGGRYPLPPPMLAECYDRVETVSPDDPRIIHSQKYTMESKQFREHTQFGRFTPGHEMSLRFRGSGISCYILVDKVSGGIEYTVDNGPAGRKFLINNYSAIRAFNFAQNLVADKEHVLKIKVLPPFEKGANMPDWMRNNHYRHEPEKYNGFDVCLGNFFIIHGEAL